MTKWTALLCALVSLLLSFDLSRAQDNGGISSKISAQYAPATVFLAVRGITEEGVQDDWKYGTGVIISSDGEILYILTTAHVLSDDRDHAYSTMKIVGSLGTTFDVSLPTGLIYPLTLVRLGANIDIALLETHTYPNQNYNPVHFCTSGSIRKGQPVHILSYPLGQSLTINSGSLTSKDNPRGYWKVDALVTEGSSGGPVFNDTGHVIGLVKGGIREAAGTNFIIPASVFSDLITVGQGKIDECANPAEQEPISCDSIMVPYNVDFAKTDHPAFNPDERPFLQKYYASPGRTIKTYQWVPLSSNHSKEPKIDLLPGGQALTVETSIASGPFFDQWRGWLQGQIVTTQVPARPECSGR